jgi:hypothetical protein
MEDMSSASSPSEKPNQVRDAVNLIYVSLAIGIVKSFLDFSRLSAQSSVGFGITVLVITFAILFLLAAMISRRKNWARILFLIMFIVGVPCYIPILFQEFTVSILAGLASVVQTTLQVIAIVLLFLR